MTSPYSIDRNAAIKHRFAACFGRSIAVITGEGGSGKSSAMTSGLEEQLRLLGERSGTLLPAVNLWPAYDLHLADFWDRASRLRGCFRAAYQERPTPATPEDLADKFLRHRGDDPRQYRRLEAKGERVAELLIERGEWLVIDGCEHWHDRGATHEPLATGPRRSHPLVAALVATIADAGDRFRGKLIITHRRGLPELPTEYTYSVPDLSEDEIERYFTERGMPLGSQLVTLFGAVQVRRPLDWRAIAEFFATAREASPHPSALFDFVEDLTTTRSQPLEAALRNIETIERERPESFWSVTNLTGLFDRPIYLADLDGLDTVPGFHSRLPVSPAERQRLSERLARTGLFSLKPLECKTGARGRASRAADWELDAHQEVRAVCARRLMSRDESSTRRAHAHLARKYFDLAKEHHPSPPDFKKDSLPDLTDWSELFSRAIFHTTKTTPAATYRAFREEYWQGVLGQNDCRLLVDYDSVAEDYRILSLVASGVRDGELFPQVSEKLAVDRAVFLSLFSLSNWHIGELPQARAVYQQAAAAWNRLGDSANQAEAIRRISEIDAKLGLIAGAVRYAELAVRCLDQDGEFVRAGNKLPNVRPGDMRRIADGTVARAYHLAGRNLEAAGLFERHHKRMFHDLEHWSLVWWYWWASLRLDELRTKFDSGQLEVVRGEIAAWTDLLERLREDKQRNYSLDWEHLHLVSGLACLVEVRGAETTGPKRKKLLAEAKNHLGEALKYGKRCSQRPHVAGCHLAMAEFNLLSGDWAGAERQLCLAERAASPKRPVRELGPHPDPLNDGAYWTWLADAAVLRAELAIRAGRPDALALLDRSEGLAKELGYFRWKPVVALLWKLHNGAPKVHTPREMAKRADQQRQTGDTAGKKTEDEWSKELKVPLTLDVLRARMRRAKEVSGLSGEEIGIKMGFAKETARQTLNGLLNRSENPGVFSLLKFAEAVGCTLADLVDPARPID